MNDTALKFGCWNIVSDIQVVNLLAKKLDFIIIDLEHGFRDFHEFNSAFTSARHLSKQVYVRVRKYDDPWIQSLLDLGVTHFVLPQIRTVNEFDSFVKATRFPPIGRRGLHPRLYQNSLNNGDSGHKTPGEFEIRICLIIETREALALMEELISRKEVDEIYFGVYDLSQELEIESGVDSPEMMLICQNIAKVASYHSKEMLAMSTTEDSSLALKKLGVTKFVLGIDASLLEESIITKAAKYRAFLRSKSG